MGRKIRNNMLIDSIKFDLASKKQCIRVSPDIENIKKQLALLLVTLEMKNTIQDIKFDFRKNPLIDNNDVVKILDAFYKNEIKSFTLDIFETQCTKLVFA